MSIFRDLACHAVPCLCISGQMHARGVAADALSRPLHAGRPQLLTCGYSGPCQLVALERTTLKALSLQKLQDMATDLPYVATATRQARGAP